MNSDNVMVPATVTCAFCEAQMASGSSGISLFYGGKGTMTQRSFQACADCVHATNEMFENRLGCGDLDFASVIEEDQTVVRGG